VSKPWQTSRRGSRAQRAFTLTELLGWPALDAPVPRPGYDRLPALAAELVRRKVDVILTGGAPSALAAKDATSTIPIVFSGVGDPVGAGVVTNLARPGGNLTGFTRTMQLTTL